MDKKKIIILVVSIVTVIILIVGIVFIGIPMYLNNAARKALTATLDNADETVETQMESLESKLDEQVINAFNAPFISYETEEDETATSSIVSTMFSIIANSNEANPERLIDVNGTVITTENLESLKGVLSRDTKYKIKCVLDDEGYVKTIELRYV